MSINSCYSIVAVCFQVVAMLLFAYGYFAVDEKMSFVNNSFSIDELTSAFESDFRFIQQRCDKLLETPVFEKFVFIIIDALRADFIPAITGGDGVRMPFTERLISEKRAIAMTSEAQTPTVTMPRIKALLSGTQPNFMDLIFNLNAAKFGEDNIIERSVSKNKRIVFYGDDTWLQMFPEKMFVRWNVTRSFFATDYTTVDTNVTENMKPELFRLRTWDYLILHYLGVDHIGHAHGGAKSIILPAKLLEMDSVVKLIYETLERRNEPYLIVITGDHGMTDAGNHGGSTDDETKTAMIFINTKTAKTETKGRNPSVRVKQIDLAVTLASFLGLPIPVKSSGKLIAPVMRAYESDIERRLCYLHRNSLQLFKIAAHLISPDIRHLLKETIKNHALHALGKLSHLTGDQVEILYLKAINGMQSSLITERSHKNFWPLFISLIIGIVTLIILALSHQTNIALKLVLHYCLNDPLVTLVTFLLLIHIFLLSSTSFIEMEPYYWLYALSTTTVVIAVMEIRNWLRLQSNIAYSKKTDRKVNNCVIPDNGASVRNRLLSAAVLLLLVRLSSSWNSHVDYDMGEWLNEKNNNWVLTILAIFSMYTMTSSVSINYMGKQRVVFLAGLFWVYLFRSDTGFLLPSAIRASAISNIPSAYKARIAYLHILVIFLIPFVNRLHLFKDRLQSSFQSDVQSLQLPRSHIIGSICCAWLLLIALISSAHNIPLIAVHVLMEKFVNYCIASNCKRQTAIRYGLVYVMFAMSAFYNTGNSNSISTIDVASGYVGLTDYNLMIVGLLVTASTYSLYVFWYLMLFIRLKQLFVYQTMTTTTTTATMQSTIETDTFISAVINLILFVRFAVVNYYEIIALILQNHLFIWTVICPKYLYEAFTTILTIALILIYRLINIIEI